MSSNLDNLLNGNLHRNQNTRKANIHVHGFGYPEIAIEHLRHIEFETLADQRFFLYLVDACTPRFVNGQLDYSKCPTISDVYNAVWPNHTHDSALKHDFLFSLGEVSRAVRLYANRSALTLQIPEGANLLEQHDGRLVISDFYHITYDVAAFEAAHAAALENFNTLSMWTHARTKYVGVFMNNGVLSAASWIQARRKVIDSKLNEINAGILRIRNGHSSQNNEPIAV